MRRAPLAAGVLAGVLSGLPSTLGLLGGHGDPVGATREIGRRWLGRPSLPAGGAVHLTFSALFALPAAPLLRGRPPLPAGAAYGAALHAINFRLLAPRLWPEVRAYDGPLQLADHVAYGVAVALLLDRGEQRP